MSTRGIFGVRIDNKDKLTYNNSDSYPECLGVNLLNDTKKLLETKGLVWMKEKAASIKLIPDGEYCFGSIVKFLNSIDGEDNYDFIKDSLFCEWGYIINFDSGKFEIYKGFQRKPHNNGRFSGLKFSRHEYYPCALIAEFDIQALPNEREFLDKLNIDSAIDADIDSAIDADSNIKFNLVV